GLEAADQKMIDDVARHVAILQAPNMSLVVNVLLRIVGSVAALLGEQYDIEISETHHRYKKDAPSGTALALARQICDATGKDYGRAVVFDRHGDDCPRQQGEISMHALRLGDNTGEHTVSFGGEGEGLELRHFSTSRDSYVLGAIKAASFIANQPPGRYTMADVLGIGNEK
ncbi:MAG: 4-hydroxy-tetrahydrodipicolinate reductase, partial [Pirellulaceae bacterium]|nr:4-hydroxy-tetrahydrodipicolinate reductase [Pirellulaceae bacterium]